MFSSDTFVGRAALVDVCGFPAPCIPVCFFAFYLSSNSVLLFLSCDWTDRGSEKNNISSRSQSANTRSVMNHQSQHSPSCQSLRRSEVGYVLLEECEVVLVDEAPSHQYDKDDDDDNDGGDEVASANQQPATQGTKLGTWYKVDLYKPNNEIGPQSNPNNNDLVLYPSVEGNDISFKSFTPILPFNGLMPEIITVGSSSTTTTANSTKTRSDASLLAGLALEVTRQACGNTGGNDEGSGSGKSINLRHLQMQSVQLVFLGRAQINSNSSNNLELEGSARMRASLLITFSLPMHHVSSGESSVGSSDTANESGANCNGGGAKRRRRTKTNSKTVVLSPAQQLIGSIIRCDWGYLEATLNKLQQRVEQELVHAFVPTDEKVASSVAFASGSNDENDNVTTDSPSEYRQGPTLKPFFPHSLTVEDLYDRISGASKHFGQVDANSIQTSSNSLKDDAKLAELLDLPDEIVATSIASYLQARSLHALRSTNRRMYQNLCKVVPGLRLKLFYHQIRSLEWMERRERKVVTESDAIGYYAGGSNDNTTSLASEYFLHEGEAVLGGDYHRAITGGSTVLLCPRPVTGGNHSQGGAMRFDSQNGVIIPVETSPVSRKSARGGLLCDDPGLGKTITVISLILRSYGLSTKADESLPPSSKSTVLSDEVIFYNYWVTSGFLTRHVRTPAIMTLIKRLLDSDTDSHYFISPIETILQYCPDYLDIIEKPISIQEIKRKVCRSDGKDIRGVEEDIRLCFRLVK